MTRPLGKAILAPQRISGRTKGQLLILSWPPAIQISARPRRIIWKARSIVLMPEEQTLLTVMEGTDSGTSRQNGRLTPGNLTAAGGNNLPHKDIVHIRRLYLGLPVRRRTSFIARAPNSIAEKSLSAPPARPYGVRHASTQTTSRNFLWGFFIFRPIVLKSGFLSPNLAMGAFL